MIFGFNFAQNFYAFGRGCGNVHTIQYFNANKYRASADDARECELESGVFIG